MDKHTATIFACICPINIGNRDRNSIQNYNSVEGKKRLGARGDPENMSPRKFTESWGEHYT